MISLESLIRLNVLTPGRRIFALQQVRKRVEELRLEPILAALNAAIAHDQHTLHLEGSLREDRSGLPVDARSVDDQIDRTLQMIAGLLTHYANDYDEKLAAKAQELSEELFPHGLDQHIQLPYVDQLVANERVIASFESAEHRAWIDEQGLRPFGNRLRELNASFGALMQDRVTVQAASWEEVKEARKRGQNLLLQVIARILGTFPGDPDNDIRTELLAPILAQDRAIQQYRRRRARIVDINPQTGQPSE